MTRLGLGDRKKKVGLIKEKTRIQSCISFSDLLEFIGAISDQTLVTTLNTRQLLKYSTPSKPPMTKMQWSIVTHPW